MNFRARGGSRKTAAAVLGQFPLDCQPGEKWLYNVGSDVLGVVVNDTLSMPEGIHPT